MDARYLKRNGIGGNKEYMPLVLPQHTCNFVGVVHLPL
jgi:hypothetical protein